MFSFATIYVISEWLIRIVMIPIVTPRRTPSVSLAWLAVIMAVPWPGLVIYVMLGSNRLGRLRLRQRAAVMQLTHTADRLARTAQHAERPALADEHQPLVNLAMNMSGLPIVNGNAVESLSETSAFIDRLINDINGAERHVHLLFYIVRDDTTGRRVADALVRAARRGVKCRVLIDDVGSRRLFGQLADRFAAGGIDLHYAMPVNLVRRRFARIDLRNHRKLAVIDSRIAYAGPQSIVGPDCGRRDLAWHDLMLRVTGPAVLHLQLVFLEDWRFETGDLPVDAGDLPDPEATGDVPLQVVPTGPSYPTEQFANLVVHAIHSAHRRLIITTPYFVPDEPSLLALKLAVMRGAQVDLVLPGRIDHPLVAAASRSYYGELLDAGIRIHRFTKGLLHAKTMTVDDAFGLVGSANFDIRSFSLNFELNLLLYGASPTAQLRFVQQHYIDHATQVVAARWRQRSVLRTIPDNAARLLSPLL
jgi:cardiolipin synthase